MRVSVKGTIISAAKIRAYFLLMSIVSQFICSGDAFGDQEQKEARPTDGVHICPEQPPPGQDAPVNLSYDQDGHHNPPSDLLPGADVFLYADIPSDNGLQVCNSKSVEYEVADSLSRLVGNITLTASPCNKTPCDNNMVDFNGIPGHAYKWQARSHVIYYCLTNYGNNNIVCDQNPNLDFRSPWVNGSEFRFAEEWTQKNNLHLWHQRRFGIPQNPGSDIVNINYPDGKYYSYQSEIDPSSGKQTIEWVVWIGFINRLQTMDGVVDHVSMADSPCDQTIQVFNGLTKQWVTIDQHSLVPSKPLTLAQLKLPADLRTFILPVYNTLDLSGELGIHVTCVSAQAAPFVFGTDYIDVYAWEIVSETSGGQIVQTRSINHK